MSATRTRRIRRAFSLVELVIVVVIIGVISAIAIPRLSRGSAGATDSAVQGNLTRLRNAIELFAAENNGAYPALADLEAALTTYNNGNYTKTADLSATKTGAFIYGPYLKSIPALPVGVNKGETGIVATYTASNGWIYDVTTGNITANAAAGEKDVHGTAYTAY